jgi:ATP-dependent helicase STH1/SNF2
MFPVKKIARVGLLPHEPFVSHSFRFDTGPRLSLQFFSRPLYPEEVAAKQREEEQARREKEYQNHIEKLKQMEEEKKRAEQEERLARKEAVRKAYLSALRTHYETFSAFYSKNSKQVKVLNQQIVSYIAANERARKQKDEKEMRARMRALKTNNLEEYAALVAQHKNSRLQALIEQTQEYMKQLGVQIQQEQSSTDSDGRSLVAMHIQEEITEQPKMLAFGTLKDYQLEGLEWLVSLYNNNLNGILADEMGLGKTIQTIALLCYVFEKKADLGPFLIIAPLSTISNWDREFSLWAPTMKVIVYNGKPQERKLMYEQDILPQRFNVLITTFEFIIGPKDRRRLEKLDWHYIIVDEGHRMKNKESKFSTTLQTRYKSRHRLILTGTPLQNNLGELWSLLNFLVPNIFNSSDNFEAWFSKPFESAGIEGQDMNEEEKQLIIMRLHMVLRPFVLRRMKSEVAKYMPDKIEVVVKCQLSAWQQILYRWIQNKINAVDPRTQ